ncbi:asparaginase [Patescibacteria group bacterium]|nr:asparaginase [Patescibacteria group bacterium]
MKRKVHVTVITTGGTIDKDYGAGKGVRDLHIGPPFAKLFLQSTFPNVVFHFKEVCRKDSLDINYQDRGAIAEACAKANTRLIIVTHGTDTMLKTAKRIFRSGIARRRTIMMTGALRPASMKLSDAEENLKLAVNSLPVWLPGVLVAMNGKVHQWNQCEKHPKTGEFVPKYS